jgi:hypothetical protein
VHISLNVANRAHLWHVSDQDTGSCIRGEEQLCWLNSEIRSTPFAHHVHWQLAAAVDKLQELISPFIGWYNSKMQQLGSCQQLRRQGMAPNSHTQRFAVSCNIHLCSSACSAVSAEQLAPASLQHNCHPQTEAPTTSNKSLFCCERATPAGWHRLIHRWSVIQASQTAANCTAKLQMLPGCRKLGRQ